jgi:3-deoxy-D-manno-octulosonic-acid transferase
LCLAQSAQDARRYETLGAPRVVVTGNLKLDAPAPDVDADALAVFRQATAGRVVWVAASTHEGEETIAAEVHRTLRNQFPDLLTVIVPRHPERGDAIGAEMSGLGLRCAQRSRAEAVDATTDIYIADTLGELGLFYRAVPIAFLGGSLIPHGGQNPIEPVRLGCAVVHGPHVHNFADIYAVIDGVGPTPAQVDDAAGLAARVAALISDPQGTRRYAEAVGDALEPFSGALSATMAALAPYVGADAR